MTSPTERKKRVWLFWSSGKDSAWTLHALNQRSDVEVTGLVSTINDRSRQIAVHATPYPLLRRQCDESGISLYPMEIPHPCPNTEYEKAFQRILREAAVQNVELMAFGDLHLADVRRYREDLFKGTGIRPVFPLWGLNTRKLAARMVGGGLRAVVTCVDPTQLGAEFAGRIFDDAFLDALPPSADPCGENGEFHTFAYDGPMFRHPVPCEVKDVVEREGMVYAKLAQGNA